MNGFIFSQRCKEHKGYKEIFSLGKQEYLNSGLRLGWLIDPLQEQVEIYRLNQSVEILSLPARLSGETVLPGFTLELPL